MSMKTALIATFAAFAACPAVPAAAGLPAAGLPPRAPAQAPRTTVPRAQAQLTGFVCQRALDPPGRAVATVAVMRPLAGTQRMELRFDLRASRAHRSPTSIHGGDLDHWISPANPTLGQRPGDVWTVNKQVVDLQGPARYRFRVTFRWRGARGRVLGEATRLSPSCLQPERRPDLLVQSIRVGRAPAAPGKPAQDLYVALIGNKGATGAGPFEVRFADGSLVELREVQRLAAHTTTSVRFLGPLCSPRAPPKVTVDPDHRIDGVNSTNNSLIAKCPRPGK